MPMPDTRAGPIFARLDSLTFTMLDYFFSHHQIKRLSKFEVIINVLVLSASFEYLCYGSTTIRNI